MQADARELHYESLGMSETNYMVSVANDRWIDASLYGGIGRFLNSSCEPNCSAHTITQTTAIPAQLSPAAAAAWKALAQARTRTPRMGLWSRRRILKGEELHWEVGSSVLPLFLLSC